MYVLIYTGDAAKVTTHSIQKKLFLIKGADDDESLNIVLFLSS